MNLKLADAAIAAYRAQGDEKLNARLDFFRTVWGVLDAHEKAAAERSVPVFTEERTRHCLKRGVPLLAETPVAVASVALTAAVADVARAFAGHEGFSDEAREQLLACNWASLVGGLPVNLAGRKPDAFLDMAVQAAHERWGENASLFASALSLALRSQLAPAAARGAKAVERAVSKGAEHPRACPVCGGEPAVAAVGPAPSGKKNGRVLWCAQCGASWEYERVRCARCGTRNQAHLHYHGVVGDHSHRLHCCDECGGYVRTRFVEELDRTPLCFEVEDVAMANLDAVAHSILHVSQNG